ncbi:NAD-dependent epimerase/dehydratase family protein [Psychromicrobium lacuslunae]|uniref:Epimerase n=1 Tax=Psychromicrobium lacuslunae TaxID=1618207 RepID=A0A0D4BXQ6_9MICC|nr:NAD-dependent epimerase/dehydratase family protein [Psychromicrobium lacuslunae]AJT41079.1 epimerase [Psychromicrobium lacuslunae]
MSQVLVTGGSGYIGGWCILAALEAGHGVRTTVRDTHKGDALRAQLHSATEFDDARLEIVQADLKSDTGWAEAMNHIDFVLHVASPTLRNGAEVNEDEMISTAREGVLRVLRVSRDAAVKRVVLTSASGAVVYGHPKEDKLAPFTEKDWTNVEASIAPYQKSKTLAERAAWDFIDKEGGGLELSAINPTGVIGPMLGDDNPPSLRTIRALLTGELPICPPFGTGWVDVRDVAELHLLAMTDPAAAGERFLATSGGSLRVVEIAQLLREHLGEAAAKVPSREMPLFIARALSFFVPQLRAIRFQLGHDFPSSGAKAEQTLGWKPRPITESVLDCAESILYHQATAR